MASQIKKGIGSQAYRNWRACRENVKVSWLEEPAYYRHVVYWGRQHLWDVDTGVQARGYFKVGKSVALTSMFRQRNEGGGEFRVYAEIHVEDNQELSRSEYLAHCMLQHKRVKGAENQQELFDIKDSELEHSLATVYVQLCKHNIHPVEVILFDQDMAVPWQPGAHTQTTLKGLLDTQAQVNDLFGWNQL